MTDTFDRLNDTERRMLNLLGQGHTAKSIAAIEDCSVNAANERLREARRKTGVGSSRELARRFAAQENRHEQIGVAGEDTSNALGLPQASTPARRRWMMPMLAMTSAALLALAVMGTWPDRPPVSSQAEPATNLRVPPPGHLAKAFDREPRDAAWAGPTERAMEDRLAAVTGLLGRKAQCATTMCQATGYFIAEVGRSSPDDLMRDLQGAPLQQDLIRLGLKPRLTSFISSRDVPRRVDYVAFWSREPAPRSAPVARDGPGASVRGSPGVVRAKDIRRFA